MKNEEAGWGTVIIIIAISFFIVIGAAAYKKGVIEDKKIAETKKFSEIYAAQDNVRFNLEKSIIDHYFLARDSQNDDYNVLRELITSSQLINPYMPTADCVRVGPVNSSVFGLDCKKK